MATPRTGRPRGRPPGAKNLPSPEAFILESLATSIPVPPIPERPKRLPARWANMTPEERSADARAMRAKRDPSTFKNAGRKKGVPSAYSAAQWEIHKAAQKPIIDRITKKMTAQGMVPDDPMAVEALKSTLLVLRSQVPPKDKLMAARLILDFTKAKPTSKVEHTIRSAEDILDEMANDDD